MLYPNEKMCEVLKVYRSCYFHWYTGKSSIRYIENHELTKLI